MAILEEEKALVDILTFNDLAASISERKKEVGSKVYGVLEQMDQDKEERAIYIKEGPRRNPYLECRPIGWDGSCVFGQLCLLVYLLPTHAKEVKTGK